MSTSKRRPSAFWETQKSQLGGGDWWLYFPTLSPHPNREWCGWAGPRRGLITRLLMGPGSLENESLLCVWPSRCGNHLCLSGHSFFLLIYFGIMIGDVNSKCHFELVMSFDFGHVSSSWSGLECGLEMLVVICITSIHSLLVSITWNWRVSVNF